MFETEYAEDGAKLHPPKIGLIISDKFVEYYKANIFKVIWTFHTWQLGD